VHKSLERRKIILRKSLNEFKEGLEAYQWEKTAEEIGIKQFPKTVKLIGVDPQKIEFIDMSLKKIGYSPKQTFKL
jgi:hypothetical protein